MNYAILGNSGSGKSTLAAWLRQYRGVAVLDLDTVAWQATTPPQRVATPLVEKTLAAFVAQHDSWAIEGCYGAIVAASLDYRPHLIQLATPVDTCIQHCRRRPFEPHKFESPDAQAAQLEFLVKWVAQYPERAGDLGQEHHSQLFNQYDGPKTRFYGTPSDGDLKLL